MKTGTDKILTLLGFKVQGDLGPITCYTSKRNKVVWYLKAPPKEPPSEHQIANRLAFANYANCWNEINADQKKIWNTIAERAHLRISGFNLFMYFYLTGDEQAIRTCCHHAGKSLLIEIPR